jgi:hypothetical protein
MYLMAATDSSGRRLGHSKMLDFASSNEIGHSANGLFDWNSRVYTVQVVQVDHIDSKALQRKIATAACIFWGTIHTAIWSRCRTRHDSKLGSENNAITPTLESLAYLYFGIAVNVGCIEKIDAQVERTMYKLDGFSFGPRTASVHIIDADAHTTKSNGGDFRAVSAE